MNNIKFQFKILKIKYIKSISHSRVKLFEEEEYFYLSSYLDYLNNNPYKYLLN
jgi:transposase